MAAAAQRPADGEGPAAGQAAQQAWKHIHCPHVLPIGYSSATDLVPSPSRSRGQPEDKTLNDDLCGFSGWTREMHEKETPGAFDYERFTAPTTRRLPDQPGEAIRAAEQDGMSTNIMLGTKWEYCMWQHHSMHSNIHG